MFCLDLLTFVCVRIEIAKNMLPSLGIKNPIFELYGYGSVFNPCFLIFCMDGMAKVVLSYLCYKPILSFHQFLTGLGCSVAEPEPPGAATFRAEAEPIFFWVGAGSRSRLF